MFHLKGILSSKLENQLGRYRSELQLATLCIEDCGGVRFFFCLLKVRGLLYCSLLSRNASHRQATYVVVGEQVVLQFVGGQKGRVPKDIQSFTRTHLKARINYYKAWRGREHAQSLIRGS